MARCKSVLPVSVHIRSRFAADNATHPGVVFDAPTLCQQHFHDECDINHIMARFAKTGVLPSVNSGTYDYFDAGESLTYHDACNLIAHADDVFSSLPATIRARFNNDPGEYLAFFEHPENYDEAVKLGFAFPDLRKAEADQSLLDVTGRTDSNQAGSSILLLLELKSFLFLEVICINVQS